MSTPLVASRDAAEGAVSARRKWWFRRRAAADAPSQVDEPLETLLAPARWQRKTRSPELAKALGFLQALVAEAARLHALKPASGDSPAREAASQRLRVLLAVDVNRLRIDSAWELVGALKRELLALGDRHYVWTQLEYEAGRDKQPGRWASWSSHFGSDERLVELLELRKNGPIDDAAQAAAFHGLSTLYLARAEAGRNRRAKAAQKCLYLELLTPLLLVLLAGLAVLASELGGGDIWKKVLLAGTAGALGATLSGIFKLRDKLVELDDLRSFWPAMKIQPLVGATSGLFVLLILETGAIHLGGDDPGSWATLALFGFVIGFSEPFFLGLVQKVAVLPDAAASKKA